MNRVTIQFAHEDLNSYQLAEFGRANEVVNQFNPLTQTVGSCLQLVRDCFSEATRTLCKKRVREFSKNAQALLERMPGATNGEPSLKRASEEGERQTSSIWKYVSEFSRFDATQLFTPADVARMWEDEKPRELEFLVEKFRAEERASKRVTNIEEKIAELRQQAAIIAQREKQTALATMSQFAAINKTVDSPNYDLVAQARLVILHPQLTALFEATPLDQRSRVGDNIGLLTALCIFMPYEKFTSLPLYFTIASKFFLDPCEETIKVFNSLANPLLFTHEESVFLEFWRAQFERLGKTMTDSDSVILKSLYATMRPFYGELLNSISMERYLRMVDTYGSCGTVNHILLTLPPSTLKTLTGLALPLFNSLLQWPLPAESDTSRFTEFHTIRIRVENLFVSMTPPPLEDVPQEKRGIALSFQIQRIVDSLAASEEFCLATIPEGCYSLLQEKFLSSILIADVLARLPDPVLIRLRTLSEESLKQLLNTGWPTDLVPFPESSYDDKYGHNLRSSNPRALTRPGDRNFREMALITSTHPEDISEYIVNEISRQIAVLNPEGMDDGGTDLSPQTPEGMDCGIRLKNLSLQ